ncbi:RNA 2',3'-cyclic phosphodiesterase [Thiohalocapsa marina]|uniref:RNA 2',3'-cyclic phosphodiesterase n=1 Tax=Thiohalocapsa marina TaxID=424902 RepID=A0A5M8FDA5_9GAMM|nr:RNA 2',3'-cyclic phosphodiesterase [Thiohalocapsa marina]KAA6182374.1 RNA 2',3'-cyclic phosphodiesterase [Thiohalocapsa marina]
MTERWFLAIWPDTQTRSALERQLAALGPLPGRPTHPLDWHVTLIFLGALEPERLACIDAAAGDAATRATSFFMELDRIGHFARSQVLWCGPARTPESLARLVTDLQAHLTRCGIAPERRPYRPHLTLARKVRTAPGLELHRPIGWTAHELVLAHGVTGERPRYRIRHRYPLP